MKKNIPKILIIIVFAISFTLHAQSTFNSETLIKAIENYVAEHNPNATKIEIKQTIKTQKFTQKGVVASISHKETLVDNCKIELIFSYNNQILSKLPVLLKVTVSQANNAKTNFNQVRINKGDRIKMLHYSGAICIRMDGVAMESGDTGDVIKVKKDNSQTLFGFIAEDGNVIIENKNVLVNNK